MPEQDASPGLTPRQRRILEAVEGRGFVTIERLAESFDVSAQTVRRDIIALDAAGLIQRFHGGAGIGGESSTVRLGHGRKRSLAQEAKRAIARSAAQLVPEGAAVFMDVGTTAEALAVELNAVAKQLTVFTNSLHVADAFRPDRHEVHVLGGVLAGSDGSLVGEETVAQVLDLRLDAAFIGCSGIEADGSVMDFDRRKIAIKRAAMRVSAERYLLAAENKFGRTARARVALLADFTRVISQ